MLHVKVGDGYVQVLQDDRLVTVQRFDVRTDDLEVCLGQVDRALEALRGCAHEVVRASWRHHAHATAVAVTDGFHR